MGLRKISAIPANNADDQTKLLRFFLSRNGERYVRRWEDCQTSALSVFEYVNASVRHDFLRSTYILIIKCTA